MKKIRYKKIVMVFPDSRCFYEIKDLIACDCGGTTWEIFKGVNSYIKCYKCNKKEEIGEEKLIDE